MNSWYAQRLTGLLASMLLWCVAGCSGEPTTPVQELERPVLRMAMSAAFVSESGVGIYADIVRYLDKKSGMRVEFVTGLDYQTINDMLESGALDAGFICGLPYVLLRDRPTPAATLVAAPVMKASRYKGQPKYYSDLIVAKNSPYSSLESLRGKHFVYNEETSNSGYNLPRYKLLSSGETSGFWSKISRSGSHEESIRMVAAGLADASFVDSLVLEYDVAKGHGEAAKVRVVESVGPAGIPPVVASSKVAPKVVEKIRRALVGMAIDPEGRRILDDALVDKFVAVDDSNYDDIRMMKRSAEQASYVVIR